MRKNWCPTPWQRVFKKIGLSQRGLAREMTIAKGVTCDPGKINRAVNDPYGYINGVDQAALVAVAKRHDVELELADFLPVSQ